MCGPIHFDFLRLPIEFILADNFLKIVKKKYLIGKENDFIDLFLRDVKLMNVFLKKYKRSLNLQTQHRTDDTVKQVGNFGNRLHVYIVRQIRITECSSIPR
ncbi:hypothetical protein L5515_000241 [Caenorhabditis briggsae]|uniref:Uncharacterized protein n=1 Tax=Caenorhabditis briggsae TaxID=6238 RepID=A0AAE9IX40_CAEBR|nr:hypothetical protein L3Y34_014150 [Caenorhabditis briggsae]UMM10499.1 hypothetical protein L5515_000241 [Caenorhabditis briggsae]